MELLYDLINIPQPDKIDDDRPVTDVIDAFVFRESFKISEGFVISEAEHCLPSLTKNRLVYDIILRCKGYAGLTESCS